MRWVNVSSEHTISWSIQPHKKSLNFGIFKHPGNAIPRAPTGSSQDSNNNNNNNDRGGLNKDRFMPGNHSSSVTDKLKNIGFSPISWIGNCEADKISQSTYDVPPDGGGNYALVFDNTFSKQTSKTATFVLLTYLTSSPPRSAHQVHHSQLNTTAIGGNQASRSTPNINPPASESTDSLRHSRARASTTTATAANGNAKARPTSSGSAQSLAASVHTGVLQKRRRKRHQGHARRFFALNFESSTLSYYHDRNSSALRGAIPLSLAAIAANDKTRDISIDSGAEIWHLRALNDHDFRMWKRALERAANAKPAVEEEKPNLKMRTQQSHDPGTDITGTQLWSRIEKLTARVASSRDKVRNLAKDTDPKYLDSAATSRSVSRERSHSPHMPRAPDARSESENTKEKRPLWKLRSGKDADNATGPYRNLSPQTASRSPAESMLPSQTDGGGITNGARRGVHGDLMQLLNEMNSVVSDFSHLLVERKQARLPPPTQTQSRLSMESNASEEFFDATDGGASPLLTIRRDSEEDDLKNEAPSPVAEDYESLSGSEVEDDDGAVLHFDRASPLFPTKPKSISPLPLDSVLRRTKVAPAKVLPPSLIGFLRKNVGKDLSTISMPVSANEPVSLLQRAAEQLEYSELLDRAAAATDELERLIYVTAFAISGISSSRVKDRSIRKPFNPLLGETYELVREDKGFRFIAEKVSHRPVQLAYQADSKDWSFGQSPKPSQKFWGKSAEIVTEGKARITLHSNGEHFSWSPATSFLRNIIAGEKYVEPVGEMCVVNETTGQKTIVTFKQGGMFAGRSEDVTVKAFGMHGEELPLGLQGNWTTSLQLTERGNLTKTTIWEAGQLVDNPAKHYGFSTFVVGLNEITSIEKGKLPRTDSRVRPDQRALEDGDLDLAEDLKARLEERQRQRRNETDESGEAWQPRWFVPADCENGGDQDEVWKLRTGKDGYWEERARNSWTGVAPVFAL